MTVYEISSYIVFALMGYLGYLVVIYIVEIFKNSEDYEKVDELAPKLYASAAILGICAMIVYFLSTQY